VWNKGGGSTSFSFVHIQEGKQKKAMLMKMPFDSKPKSMLQDPGIKKLEVVVEVS